VKRLWERGKAAVVDEEEMDEEEEDEQIWGGDS
jgi:hypothetical protein